jgi:hypothetical protein
MIKHTEKWVYGEGDPNQFAIGVTKATIDRILKLPKHRGDALALYLFYAYTARWQKTTSEVWATVRYACNGLGWGQNKLLDVKKTLMSLGLVENVMVRDQRGRVTQRGWRVKVNYIIGRWRHDDGIVEGDPSQTLVLPDLVKSNAKEDGLVEDPKKKKNKKSRFDLPEELSSLESVWKEWLQYKRERRTPMTTQTFARQINHLKRLGVKRAQLSIEQSIENGWTGLFDPRGEKPAPIPIRTRNEKINELNREKARLMRDPSTPAWKIERINVQLHKL